MSIIKSVEERYTDKYKALTPHMEEEIDLYKTAYNSQRDVVKGNYNSLITDSNEEYYDEENRNAIQKIVDEKKIAENMENLGLTDSGLNRTQQTAVQLSHSNNQAKLERQRQKAVDALNLEMTNKLTEIDTNESSTTASIKDKYHQAALSAAQSEYNSDVEAETTRRAAEIEAENKRLEGEREERIARIKAEIEAENKRLDRKQEWDLAIAKAGIEAETALQKAQISAASKGGSGSSGSGNSGGSDDFVLFTPTGQQKIDDNGNAINYYRGSDGKTYYAKVGTNPYTGRVHNDVLDKSGNYDASKAFANGYQPNNIGGTKLKSVPGAEIEIVEGHGQKVWQKGNTNEYYYWDGSKNQYIKLTESELVALGIK